MCFSKKDIHNFSIPLLLLAALVVSIRGQNIDKSLDAKIRPHEKRKTKFFGAFFGISTLLMLAVYVKRPCCVDGGRCVLSDAEIEDVFNEEKTTWMITDRLYQQHGIQEILDCAADNDVISLNLTKTVAPTERIVVRRNVTIDGTPPSDANPSRAQTKFTCPSGKGLFLVRDCDFALKNVVIQNCKHAKTDGVASIIETARCSHKSSQERELRLFNVTFKRNENLGGSVGLVVHDPACHVRLFMRDVLFHGNGYRRASRLARENILENVVVKENEGPKIRNRNRPFFFFPRKFIANLTDLVVADNRRTAFVTAYDGQLEIADSKFIGNSGNNIGVVFAFSTRLTVKNSQFIRNDCQGSGAAILVYKGSTAAFSFCEFLENNSTEIGGSVYIKQVRSVLFESCRFVRNTAAHDVDTDEFVPLGQGGAVFYQGHFYRIDRFDVYTSKIVFKKCDFIQNRAYGGSAVYFIHVGGKILFRSCIIRENEELFHHKVLYKDVGGVVQVFASRISTFRMRQSVVERNSGVRGGGVSIIGAPGKLYFEKTIFRKNRALREAGGGVFVRAIINHDEPTSLKIRQSVFRENEGSTLGGSVYASGKRIEAELYNCTFANNSAVKGAAVLADAVDALVITDCIFRGNGAAISGGAIAAEAVVTKVFESTFIENKSQYGGAIAAFSGLLISRSAFRGNEAGASGGALHVNYRYYDPIDEVGSYSYIGLFKSTFVNNRADGSGGAVHNIMNVDLKTGDCIFKRNRASVGGGLSILHGPKRQWKHVVKRSKFFENRALIGGAISLIDASAYSFPPDREPYIGRYNFRYDAKRNFSLTHTEGGFRFRKSVIERNTAERSGGGIYCEDITLLKIDDQPMKHFRQQNVECPNTVAIPSVDMENIRNNTVRKSASESHEENLSTISSSFCVTVLENDQPIASIRHGGVYRIEQWKSGEIFPVLRVTMHDSLGNNFSQTKPPQPLTGSQISEPQNAYGNVASAMLRSKRDASFPHSFLTNDVSADLSSGVAVIEPGHRYAKPGHYQLTLSVEGFPSSEVIIQIDVRRCTINEQADVDAAVCTQCDSNQYNFDAGNDRSKCIRCPEHGNCSTVFTLPQAGYWNSFPCSHHMDRCLNEDACTTVNESFLEGLLKNETSCAFDDATRVEYQSSHCAENYEDVLCGSCKNTSGRLGAFVCAACIPKELAAMGLIGMIILQLCLALLQIKETLDSDETNSDQDALSLRVIASSRRSVRSVAQYESLEHGLEVDRASIAARSIQTTSSRRATDIRNARWRFLQTLKITINLLQTVVAAASLDVSWTRPSLDLFKSFDSIGGSFAITSSFSLDCLLPTGTAAPRTIIRQILIALLPVLISLAICVSWSLLEIKSERIAGRLARRIILVHIVVAYNFYLLLFKVAVDAYNCISVHDSSNLDDIQSIDRYWALDTSIRCYTSSHLLFIRTVSIPLLLFGVSYPVLLAVFLVNSRKNGTLSSTWTQETMGFLFAGFEERFVHWDCLILLRKAVISVIVVFAYQLGRDLQGLLAMAVLVLALFFQARFAPFKHELGNLNALESASLLVSFFTFFCGLLFGNEKLKGVFLRGILTVLVVGSNIGLFVVLFFLLAKLKFRQIKLKLDENQVHCGQGRPHEVILAFAKYQFTSFCMLMCKWWQVDDRETTTQPTVELSRADKNSVHKN